MVKVLGENAYPSGDILKNYQLQQEVRTMASYLIKGILIGLLFGLPVGAIGTMTVQRSWSFGFRAGLLTGLGSSVADCLYALVGAFGLTLISDFLLQYQAVITVLGGILILFMGVRLLISKGESPMTSTKKISGIKMFLSSFAIGITNPAAILTFLFAFTYFGISDVAGLRDGISLVCGVFIGTYLWWGTLSVVTCAIKAKTKLQSFLYMNQVFGTVLTLFGATVFLRTVF